jgi:hypothetical protein
MHKKARRVFLPVAAYAASKDVVGVTGDDMIEHQTI